MARDSQAEVVHLNGGGEVIGSIAPSTDPQGPILVETLDGTTQILRDQVQRLETAEELRATLPAARSGDWKGLLRRVEAAVEQGLYADALEAADRALLAIAKAKDAPQFALPPRFLDLPVGGVRAGDTLDEEAANALLALAGDEDRPASALIAARRVADVIANPALAAAAIANVEATSPKTRKAALLAISRTLPEDGLEPAIGRMLLDPREDVRKAAVAAVASFDHDGIAYPVARALATDDRQVRGAAMDAVEELGITRAVGALVRNLRRTDSSGKTRANLSSITHTSYVGDFDVEIAQAAVIGQPVVKVLQHGVVQDFALAGVFSQRVPRTERARIVSLLSSLTGESFGDQPEQWSQWLEAQRAPQDGQRSSAAKPAAGNPGPASGWPRDS